MAPILIAAATPFESVFRRLILPLLASLQIGALITWGLQGILCVQVYNYYLSFPKDPLHMKLLVYFTLALEIAQTLMVTRDAYEVFAKGFGDFPALNDLHLLWLTLPVLGGLVGLSCHLVFAYRISVLAESRLIGCMISSLALCASIAAFVFGGNMFKAGVLSKTVTVQNIYLMCGIWNGSGAFCDAVIAGCMSYYLSRSHTGFKNTDLLITRIIRLTIETGVFTATASILSAVLFVGFRQKLTISVYFIVPAIMITKLYAITILATFNNRPHAVGGPPPLLDNENSLDENKTFSRNLTGEIRIARTVVQQVWKDDVPLSHLKMYGSGDETVTIKDDSDCESSREAPESLAPGDEPEKF